MGKEEGTVLILNEKMGTSWGSAHRNGSSKSFRNSSNPCQVMRIPRGLVAMQIVSQVVQVAHILHF